MRFEDPATGRNVIDPASYTQVESTPVGLLKMLSAIPNGFEQAAQIVILTFCVSGTFNLITSAGLIPALLKNVSRNFGPGNSCSSAAAGDYFPAGLLSGDAGINNRVYPNCPAADAGAWV